MWWIGVSRFRDNYHQVEDIVAGWFLGTFCAIWAVWQTALTQQWQAERFAQEFGDRSDGGPAKGGRAGAPLVVVAILLYSFLFSLLRFKATLSHVLAGAAKVQSFAPAQP